MHACSVAQLGPTLWDSMDYTVPDSCVHGIFQARILKWVAISFFRRSSPPRDWTQVSHTVGRRFTIWATREGTISVEAEGKCLVVQVIGNALGKCQFAIDTGDMTCLESPSAEDVFVEPSALHTRAVRMSTAQDEGNIYCFKWLLQLFYIILCHVIQYWDCFLHFHFILKAV